VTKFMKIFIRHITAATDNNKKTAIKGEINYEMMNLIEYDLY